MSAARLDEGTATARTALPPPGGDATAEARGGVRARAGALSPHVARAVERRLAPAREEAARDIDRLVDATYEEAERSGTAEPTLRGILRTAGVATETFYRNFTSKDELLVVVLADGRERLAGYLAHQMAKAPDARGRVKAWIEGVLAQAADPAAASRTRPFIAGTGRLTERFPEEIALSVHALVSPLEEALADAGAPAATADALAVYRLVMSAMQTHVLAGTSPSPDEVEHLVAFCLRAATLDGR